MAPFSRNYQTQANVRLVENHPDGITQTIASRDVDGGTANGAGGCDYVIGTAGAPSLLSTGSDTFPGQTNYAISTSGGLGTTSWTPDPPAAGAIGLVPNEGNTGATAVATVPAGYNCQTAPTTACTPGTLSWNNAAKGSWDNIVGTISTDSSGNITSSTLFFVHVVAVVGGTDNSWLAYTANVTRHRPRRRFGGCGG